jgi:hypothetical protein
VKIVQKIESDKTPPKIFIISPSNVTNGTVLSVKEESFILMGQVTDSGGVSSIQINNNEVTPDSKGYFQYAVKLNDSHNKLNIITADVSGNKSVLNFSVIFTISSSESVAQEPRGAKMVNKISDNDIAKTGKYYALLIAAQDYNDNRIDDLKKPISDAKTLGFSLTSYYVFDSIRVLLNATRSSIMGAIYEYRRTLKPEDNFLIFYSGHGYWDKENDHGYWLPIDADLSNPSTWISNSDIKDQIKPMKCEHTLLISDACFSGGIFKTRSVDINNASRNIQELYKTKSRKAMTSGALTEVPDQSVFLKYLLEALINNNLPYLSSEKLFGLFKENAINNTLINGLIPQFGVIADTDDRGGDFIFIKK